jgi:hypothetical protein
MYKYSIKYGILAGALSGTIMVIAFYAGYPTKGNRYLTVINLILMYAPSFLAIYSVRKVNEGEITFKNALKIGILASVIGIFIYTCFSATYYYILNPNFANKYLPDIEISLKQAGVTGAELKKQMAEWREELSAFNRTITIFFGSSILSSILGGINALVLCKKD